MNGFLCGSYQGFIWCFWYKPFTQLSQSKSSTSLCRSTQSFPSTRIFIRKPRCLHGPKMAIISRINLVKGETWDMLGRFMIGYHEMTQRSMCAPDFRSEKKLLSLRHMERSKLIFAPYKTLRVICDTSSAGLWSWAQMSWQESRGGRHDVAQSGMKTSCISTPSALVRTQALCKIPGTV